MTLTAIILTFNEEKHLSRCIASLEGVVTDIVVVDCYSSDATVDIAKAHGARVLQRKWVNHSYQFNWALAQLDYNEGWVFRIDADEVLSSELAEEIVEKLPALPLDINGVYCHRRICFQGKIIRHGGIFPISVLRIFRIGKGECERRWMDEHIRVLGSTAKFNGEIIDDNLNTLTWWTDKHNKYASLEAVELLNLEYGFMPRDPSADSLGNNQAGLKRWLKVNIYVNLPCGFRAFVYFFYRYVVRLGFLDGQAGTSFHFLQAFWYRYLVDAKVIEVKKAMNDLDLNVVEAIECVLNVKVSDEDGL